MDYSLTYTQLLRRNRSFRRLWTGQVISELGNWFNFIAALGVVRVVSNAAPEVTTILLIVRLIPFTLFAPLAGAFVDRWSRRTVMIATDILRVFVALGFLFVRRPEHLWIAYFCTGLLSFFGAFFEAAKNAAVPNITGERDLLAGNALMFSSRFLFMSVGAALGGWTAAQVGYHAAFVINAASFLVSAYSVWLVPEEETRQTTPPEITVATRKRHRGYWSDIREGWTYIVQHRPVAAILGANILWATGGGAINLIAERLGALVFSLKDSVSPDTAVAALYFAGGLGLFVGMMIARRVGAYVELKDRTVGFIGWSLLIQGVIFALIGFMPGLWLAGLMLFGSRVLLGAEFAVQETLLMRLVPDNLRGRVSTTDRASEMLVWSFSTAVAGWSLHVITPRSLTIISGLLSGSAGVVWLILFAMRIVRLPILVSRRAPSSIEDRSTTTSNDRGSVVPSEFE
ncbi:MAG TPA: MFS transporter [Pyrinomonadaceae bacterium]|nr:MFS transporter [Pyrinomonadaceae bacterium]